MQISWWCKINNNNWETKESEDKNKIIIYRGKQYCLEKIRKKEYY